MLRLMPGVWFKCYNSWRTVRASKTIRNYWCRIIFKHWLWSLIEKNKPRIRQSESRKPEKRKMTRSGKQIKGTNPKASAPHSKTLESVKRAKTPRLLTPPLPHQKVQMSSKTILPTDQPLIFNRHDYVGSSKLVKSVHMQSADFPTAKIN